MAATSTTGMNTSKVEPFPGSLSTDKVPCIRSTSRCEIVSPSPVPPKSSVLGWRAQKGQAHYAAAKAGVMALTRCAGLEGAEYGVRVNAVAPSLALHPFLYKVTSKELLAELEAKEAFGRGSEVWEQANAMIFLASDYSSYMTGEVISTSSQKA